MEVFEKQCIGCQSVKPVMAYGIVKKTGRYKGKCKDCEKAAVDAVRYGPAAEVYKERERLRSAKRAEYIRQWQAANPERMKEISQRAQANARPHYTSAKSLSTPVYFNTCAHTGILFASRTHNAKYCKEGKRIQSGIASFSHSKKSHDALLLVYQCKQCQQPFSPEYGEGRRTYCGDECADLAQYLSKLGNQNHRKRAHHYGVEYKSIDVFAVFARHGWMCQLCGIATPKGLRGTCEPNAPELDHITPMSKGGTHTLSNVQCACRRCNGAKGEMLPHLFALSKGGGLGPCQLPLW